METFSVILILVAMLMAGLSLFYFAVFVTERSTKKKVVVGSIFREFSQKMWMTVGLGVVFFCLYLAIAIIGSYFNTPQSRLDFFFMMYENPVIFIYLGLLIFAAVSTCIYLVRIVIKHFYNTRRY